MDNGKILGFGADLAKEHPGFLDEAYKRRRMDIVSLAKSHTFGEPIPRVEYSSSEVTAWGAALRELKALYPTHACKEFLRNWDLFEFREDVVPQLQVRANRSTHSLPLKPTIVLAKSYLIILLYELVVVVLNGSVEWVGEASK